MIKTSRQLKDLIRNMSQKKNTEPLILMRNYMMERFLERLTLSEYRNQLILKGGMLITAMVGIDTRTTMDMDTTIKGILLDRDTIDHIVSEIILIEIDDGVSYHIKSISKIMEESDYPGIRVNMEALFDGVKTPLKIDFSTGDVIMPHEIIFDFPLLFEERIIPVLAYPLETVLAEKLETIISRSITNTRMRDLYDIYILLRLYSEQLQHEDFFKAFKATIKKRSSILAAQNAATIIDEIANDQSQKRLWSAYQQKFSYAAAVNWSDATAAVRTLINMTSFGTCVSEEQQRG